MGETRPGIKSMKKTVGQQHHKEVAQVHPVPGTEVLELKEYVVGSGPTDITLSSAPTLKLTARHREPLTTRRKVSDETKEEIQEEDEATLRELLMSGGRLDYGLQKQVSVMSMNLSTKLDELQRGDRQLETTVALCEIRSQLQELTKSVESCQSEVSEVKRDMVAIKHELDTVQQVKEEIEELREYVDRLGEQSHRRKLRLLEQGLTFFLSYAILAAVLGMLQFGYNTGVINAPQVALHADLFPNKSSLQLKIREVRQKMMAQNNQTPMTPGSMPSPMASSTDSAATTPGCSSVPHVSSMVSTANSSVPIPASSSS